MFIENLYPSPEQARRDQERLEARLKAEMAEALRKASEDAKRAADRKAQGESGGVTGAALKAWSRLRGHPGGSELRGDSRRIEAAADLAVEEVSGVEALLADARSAWAEHRTAAFDHAMTEPFSAFVLASIERALSKALADLKRAETLGHGEDADFAHETVAMLTANREALRTARAARGWSEDGDEAPEA